MASMDRKLVAKSQQYEVAYFARNTGLARPMRALSSRWVEPRLLAEVEYTEITPDGLVRHPSFKGLREDKPAADVHLEKA